MKYTDMIINNYGDYQLIKVPIIKEVAQDLVLVNLNKIEDEKLRDLALIVFSKRNWILLNIPTGLYLCANRSRRLLFEDFARLETRYYQVMKDEKQQSKNIERFKKMQENNEYVKIKEESEND